MKHASVDRAKRYAIGCRNHGSCPWCQRSRTMDARRVEQDTKEEAKYERLLRSSRARRD